MAHSWLQHRQIQQPGFGSFPQEKLFEFIKDTTRPLSVVLCMTEQILQLFNTSRKYVYYFQVTCEMPLLGRAHFIHLQRNYVN
ncbi:hypothetical protein M758_3G150800 [Ceratodon purpureus]|nr:hypothetical protein M758_3G150800 [Ceratodon purpureus]